MPDLQPILDELRDAYSAWGYPVVFLGGLLENAALRGVGLAALVLTVASYGIYRLARSTSAADSPMR